MANPSLPNNSKPAPKPETSAAEPKTERKPPCTIKRTETEVAIPGYGKTMVGIFSAVDNATGAEVARNHDRAKCVAAAKVHYGMAKARNRGGAVLSLLRLRKSAEKIADTRVDKDILVNTITAMLGVLSDAGENVAAVEKMENDRIANVKAAKTVA